MAGKRKMSKSTSFVGYQEPKCNALRPLGYQRVIHGSIASPAMRGYDVSYVEIFFSDMAFTMAFRTVRSPSLVGTNGHRRAMRILPTSMLL